MTEAARLDRLFDALARKPTGRNALMAVEAPGLSWRRVAGHLRADSQYCIASCTKLYTAALVLQLADAGRVDLEAAAVRHLPPGMMDGLHVWRGEDVGRSITVAQLLSNTSGLADYFEERPRGGTSLLADIAAGHDVGWTHEEALARVRRGLAPHFAPGTPGKAHYSDTNFQLLGAVLEQLTGQPYGQLVAERVSARIGQAHTFVFGEETQDAYERIVGISAGRRELRVPRTLASLGAQGGVISTLDDSLLFLRAFFAGELFDRDWIGRMQNWNRVFFPFRYGMGLMQFAVHPAFTLFRRVPPMIGHSGSSGILMFYCPERETYVCGATNQLKARGLPYQFMLKALMALA